MMSKKVLLLGAGASAGIAGADNAPVASEFGRILTKLDNDWRIAYPFLFGAIRFLSTFLPHTSELSWPLDKVWGTIDNNYKLRKVLSQRIDDFWPNPGPANKVFYSRSELKKPSAKAFWMAAGWDLKRAVAFVYGARLNKVLDKAARRVDRFRKLVDLGAFSSNDFIISMNYDLVVERIAKKVWSGARNVMDKDDETRPRKAGPIILKPHGSLDWRFKSPIPGQKGSSRVDRKSGNEPLIDDEIDDREGVECRPLLVGPVPYKDEIVFQRAQPKEMRSVVEYQWGNMVRVISEADELLVVGYRFPEEDGHAIHAFREVGRRRMESNGNPLKIRLFLPPPERAETKYRLETFVFFGRRPPLLYTEECEPI